MEKNLSEIAIEGMEFYAHHGCFKEETIIGANFKADIILFCDTSMAQKTDNLDATINYVEVYNIIKEEMKKPSKLIEHVAHRIINEIKAEFKEVAKCEIKLSKINPPLGEKIKAVSVKICK